MKIEIKIIDNDNYTPLHIKFEYELLTFKFMLEDPQYLKQMIEDIEDKLKELRTKRNVSTVNQSFDPTPYV